MTRGKFEALYVNYNGTMIINDEIEKQEILRKYLEDKGLSFFEAQVSMVPQNKITLSDEDLVKFNKLVAALEDLDDVQKVTSNIEIADEIMEKLAEED